MRRRSQSWLVAGNTAKCLAIVLESLPLPWMCLLSPSVVLPESTNYGTMWKTRNFTIYKVGSST